MIRKNDALGLCLHQFRQNHMTRVWFKAIWQEQKTGNTLTLLLRRNTVPCGAFRGIQTCHQHSERVATPKKPLWHEDNFEMKTNLPKDLGRNFDLPHNCLKKFR